MTNDSQDQKMSLEKAEKIMNNYEDYSRVSVNKASRRISKEKDLSGGESSSSSGTEGGNTGNGRSPEGSASLQGDEIDGGEPPKPSEDAELPTAAVQLVNPEKKDNQNWTECLIGITSAYDCGPTVAHNVLVRNNSEEFYSDDAEMQELVRKSNAEQYRRERVAYAYSKGKKEERQRIKKQIEQRIKVISQMIKGANPTAARDLKAQKLELENFKEDLHEETEEELLEEVQNQK